MNLQTRLSVAALAAAVASLGCQKAEDDYAPVVKPKSYSFEGQIDAKYVGKWSAADGSSMLDIEKDGVLNIETVTNSVSGKNVSHLSGKWLTEDKSLMFRYAVGAQAPIVLKYTAALAGNVLTLTQEGSALKTTYKRK